jgi:hypothetical protein
MAKAFADVAVHDELEVRHPQAREKDYQDDDRVGRRAFPWRVIPGGAFG